MFLLNYTYLHITMKPTVKINRAIILFMSNERKNNSKNFRSKSTYDLLDNRVVELITQVKEEFNVDTILCSDDSSLLDSNLFIKQHGESFEEKFNNAIINSFQSGYDEIIVIGNDSPELTSQHIIEAFLHISGGKVVLGPSYDGGIYLLGLSKKSISSKITARWNTSNVKSDLVKLFRDKEVLMLDYLYDIDNQNDLVNWFLTESQSAILFQKLLAAVTSVKQKKHSTVHLLFSEQNFNREHTQKAPPNLISFN